MRTGKMGAGVIGLAVLLCPIGLSGKAAAQAAAGPLRGDDAFTQASSEIKEAFAQANKEAEARVKVAAESARRARGRLSSQVVEPGLAMLAAHDPNGLGAQAAAVGRWREGRRELYLAQGPRGWALRDAEGRTLRITREMGEALRRMNDFFGLNPEVPRDLLKAALLSEPGVLAVRGLFEESIRRRLVAGGKVLVPEVSGEATLGPQGLAFHLTPDHMLPILKRLETLRSDQEGLAELFRTEAEKMGSLDPQGQLRRFLFEKLPQWEAKDFPPRERRDAMLRMHVDSIIEQAVNVSSGSMKATLEAMTSHEWSGRYVGLWHTHPPQDTPAGFDGVGDFWSGPSSADKEAAYRSGQNLTIAFYPDGFNAYDLSDLKSPEVPDEQIPVVSYRSPAWREFFAGLHGRLSGPND